MKVTTDTPELFIVDHRPLLLGIGLGLFILAFVGAGLTVMTEEFWPGLAFAGFGGGLGLAAFWAFVRRVQVVFNRPQNSVEIRRKSLFRQSRLRFGLDELRGAEVEETRSDGSTLYRVALVASGGEMAGRYPLTEAYSNTGSPHRTAQAINDWLAKAQTKSPARGRA